MSIDFIASVYELMHPSQFYKFSSQEVFFFIQQTSTMGENMVVWKILGYKYHSTCWVLSLKMMSVWQRNTLVTSYLNKIKCLLLLGIRQPSVLRSTCIKSDLYLRYRIESSDNSPLLIMFKSTLYEICICILFQDFN